MAVELGAHVVPSTECVPEVRCVSSIGAACSISMSGGLGTDDAPCSPTTGEKDPRVALNIDQALGTSEAFMPGFGVLPFF
eukprot:8408800-Pyramimonas_sp.AAC.2